MTEQTNQELAALKEKLQLEERQLWETVLAVEKSPEFLAQVKRRDDANLAWSETWRKLEAVKLLEAQ